MANTYIELPSTAIPSASPDVNVHDGAGNSVTSEAVGPKTALDVNIAAGSVTVAAAVDTNVHDGTGVAITSTVVGPGTGLDVNLVGGSVTIENAELAVEVSAADGDNIAIADATGTNFLAISAAGAAKVDGSAVIQPISAAALPLPAGASTSALQTTGNASLTSIDSKLTAPLSVTGPLTDIQLRASAVPVSAVALPLPAGAATEATLSSLNAKVTAVNTGAVVVSSSALPTGAATSALQTSGNASLTSIDSKLTSPLTVTGPLTDTQLRLSPVPVSASSLPLPTGAATEATLSSLNAKVVAVDTGAVVVASSALPSGASTAALQTTGNTSLSSIDGKTPALVGGRQPVDGSGVTQPISAVALPLPSGAATAALQTQPGVDIGDVTINNAVGVNAVNIQDGGNSITVDGTLTIGAGNTATYAAGTANTTAAASSTDLFTITGSGTKTIKIHRITLCGYATTTGNYQVFAIKRSTADTGGTSTAVTAVPVDSNNAAATATATVYTANPTLGTAVGNVVSLKIGLSSSGAASQGLQGFVMDFTDLIGQPVTLRGTSQQLAINFGGQTANGFTFSIMAVWTEE